MVLLLTIKVKHSLTSCLANTYRHIEIFAKANTQAYCTRAQQNFSEKTFSQISST